MGFNINQIRGELEFGGARNTLFEINISFPVGVDQGAARKVPVMATAASLPPTEMGMISVPWFGRTIKIAGDRTYPDWTVTINNDEDFKLRHAFEQWIFQMNTTESNFALPTAATPGQYKRDAKITQYSKTKQILRVYNFNGLFPVMVSPIQMDWGATNQIEKFDVTFAYDFHEVVDGPTGSIQG